MVLGAGMAGGTGTALAEEPAAPGLDLSNIDIGALLDNEMITQFVEMCRTGDLANHPGNSQSTTWNPEDVTDGQLPPDAIVSCTDSTGTGLALVLPERFEIGQLANNMYIDTGDDIKIPLIIDIPMGERNLFELIGGLLFDAPKVAGLVNVRGMAESQFGISADPRMFGMFQSYDEVAAAANIGADIRNKDVCIDHMGRYTGDYKTILGCGFLSPDTRIRAGQDINNRKRNMAREVLEYLAGDDVTYPRDSSVPIDIPSIPKPKGQSVIKGDGINVALSMRGGRAFAETGNDLAVALAAADKGRLASAYAKYGIAIAADMDLNDLRFTWFGKDVDFSNLLPLLESDMAKEAMGEDGDMVGMLDMIGDINGQIPAIKEVFCYGVNAQATAESFGSCSNFLGTFDTYKDLRPANARDLENGYMSRQESQGIQDITSLIFGNDALLKNFLPMLEGSEGLDLGGLMSNPAVAKMLGAALSEEQRIKFGKDFIRYTKNITTEFDTEQATDANGNLLWDDVTERVQETDDDGKPLWVDEDGNVYTKDADGNFVDSDDAVVDGLDGGSLAPKMVERIKQQQVKDADGNLVFEGAGGAVFTKGADGTWRDSTGAVVDDIDPDTLTAQMENVQTPRLKNRTAARMVGVTEDAWEEYISDEPEWVTETKSEQAKDDDGQPIWIVEDEDGAPQEIASADQPDGGTPKMIDVTEKVAKRDADGNIIYQKKTRYFKKPVMVEQKDADGNTVYRDATDADADYVWLDGDGQVVTDVDETDEASLEGLTKKAPVMVQKMEQAKDENGNLLWDPVVAKTVTAHWLTSDYGLREPLVIEWLGHQIVFFPAVELNDGSTRPNLIGAPQISKIVGDANAGLLPKINLVQWDNPLGLGTWSFDKPWDVFGTAKAFKKSITLDDDLKMLDKLVGPMVFPGSERLTDGLLEQLGLKKPKSPELPIEPADPETGEDDGIEAGDTGTDPEGTESSSDPDTTASVQARPSAPAQTQDPAASSAPSATPSAPSTTPAAPSSPTVEADPVEPESLTVTPDPTTSVPSGSVEVPSVSAEPQTTPAAPSEQVQSGQDEPVGAALIGG